MIKATSKDGKIKRELIYNQSVLMVDKYDSLSFQVIDVKLLMNVTFNFEFSDTGKKYSAEGKISEDGSKVNLTLNNWYSTSRVENTVPMELNLKSGTKLWVKYCTTADEKNSLRLFHLTVWGETKNEQ
jgi:Domain of unknown function (DUF6864)